MCATTIALVLMRITVEVPQVQLIFMVFHRSSLLGQGCGHARCCARLCSGPDVQKQFLDKDGDMPVVVQRQVLVSLGPCTQVHGQG